VTDVVLGVDVGTTATKVQALDAAGRVHAEASRPHALEVRAPGRAEQDPRAVAAATRAAIAETVAVSRPPVAGLALSGAMHSLIGVGRGGEALTPSVTWADTRATPQADRLRASPDGPALHARTGTPVHPMSPLVKLRWFAEAQPGLFRRVRTWAGIKEWIVHDLTGAWATDHSIASGTGLMALASRDWDPGALAYAGIDASALPALVPTDAALPLAARAADALGLPAGLPVVVGAGDGPLANVGAGAVRPGVAACSAGTSGALRVVVERPSVDPGRSVFCYALTPGRWVVGGAINNGGVVLDWAADALTPDLGPEPHEALLALAARAPAGCDGLLMLPALLSERAPAWSAVPRGAYVGLTRAHRREHLVRAALEGVAQQLALVLASVEAAGGEVRAVHGTGG